MNEAHLDGNVLAGMLSGLFAVDATMLTVECRGCGAAARVADTAVELDDAAAIVRCRTCTHTLFTVMEHEGKLQIIVESLRSIRAAPR